jgi:integrase
MSAATGSIRKRGKRYYIRTRVRMIDPQTGEQVWKQVEKAASTSHKQAVAELKALQGNVDTGEFVPTSMTVLDLGQKWLREHVQPNLKAGAAANYKGTFYKHVAPELGAVRVDECRQQMVKALLGRKREQGLSDETVAKIRRHMHAMFAFGQDAGLLTVNPAAAPRKRGQKHRRRARGTALSPVQVKRFLDACSIGRDGKPHDDARWRLFFIIALDTGLRRGELVGLQWGDVALRERVIYVRRSIGNYDDPAEAADLTTKTEAGERLVPILHGAQHALEVLFKSAKDTRDEAPVFATIERKRGRDGVMRPTGRPLSPRMVTRVFRKYADDAKLPESVRLHDLRHTAITRAIRAKEDILLVSSIAGHARTSITVDTYGHLDPEWVQEAARRMASVADPLANKAEVTKTDGEDGGEGDQREALAHKPAHTLPTSDDGQHRTEAEASA